MSNEAVDQVVGTELVRAGVHNVNLITSESAEVRVRDQAILTVCGEIVVGLEARKVELQANSVVLSKEVGKARAELAKAQQVEIGAAMETVKAEYVDALNDVFAKLPKLGIKASVAEKGTISPDGKNVLVDVTIGPKNTAASRYSSSASYSVPVPIRKSSPIHPATKDLAECTEAFNANVGKEAECRTQLAKMPDVERKIKAAVARHDLLKSDAGREVYAAVKSQFGGMIPAELKAYLFEQ